MLEIIKISLACSNARASAIFFSHIFDIDPVICCEEPEEIEISVGSINIIFVSGGADYSMDQRSPNTFLQFSLSSSENVEDLFKKMNLFFYTHPQITQHLSRPQLRECGEQLVLQFQDPSRHSWKIFQSSIYDQV